MRPYAFGRKKERLFGFLVLGGKGERAYAIRPYPFDRKKDCPLGFPALEKDGT